jgi:uncharacterized protein (TIGR03437 family)
LNPSSLQFAFQTGGTWPQAQIVTVASTGSAPLPVNVSTSSSGNWLLVTASTGTTPTALTVSINPTGLTAATYNGTITVTASGAGNSPLQLPVTLNVAPIPTLTALPSSLSFAFQSGGSPPPTQVISLGSSGATLSFSAVAASTGSWLSVASSSNLTPASLTISVNPAGLAVGTYNGTITVNAPDASNRTLTIPATLTVSASPVLSIAPLSLMFAHDRGQTTPSPQDIRLTSNSPLAFSAKTEGGGWLSVSPAAGTTPATLKVAIDPTGLALGAHTAKVIISASGASNSLQTVNVTLNEVAVGTPTVLAVTNGASFSSGALAPGEVLAIFGEGIGPDTLASFKLDLTLRIPTELERCRVLVDGISAPIIYAWKSQVGTIVPYAIAGRTTAKLQLEYLRVRSNLLEFKVEDASPALFTAEATGVGQGAILNQNYSVNSETNPADKDSIVMMYATGEGQTDPRGVDGKVASVPLPAPLLPVTVRIGGVDAEVLYAGAAPGLVAGVMQVNVRVPASAPSGTAVPVQFIVGGIKSPSGVTLAVR